MIRFFTEPAHYQKKYRKELFFLLKVFFKDSSIEQIRLQYGSIIDQFLLENYSENADLFILPMSWNYYYKNGKKEMALEFIKKVESYKKPLLSFITGDAGVTPMNKDVYVFRSSGYHSKKLKNQHALPVFFDDPLMKYYKRTKPFLREKKARPVIGFCGHANISAFETFFNVVKSGYKNLKYHLKISFDDPQPLYPAGLRRWRCLKELESSPDLDDNFVKRKNYRAGARDENAKIKTSIEFYDNMINSDYVLCIRGAGNFSARLYETLAMGRIPVFVNTNCLLPFEQLINWKDYVVWVEAKDIKDLPEIIKSFHDNLSASEFEELQLSCRKLWEDYLSFKGYLSNFHKLFFNYSS